MAITPFPPAPCDIAGCVCHSLCVIFNAWDQIIPKKKELVSIANTKRLNKKNTYSGVQKEKNWVENLSGSGWTHGRGCWRYLYQVGLNVSRCWRYLYRVGLVASLCWRYLYRDGLIASPCWRYLYRDGPWLNSSPCWRYPYRDGSL
jgi:hypothetical protein